MTVKYELRLLCLNRLWISIQNGIPRQEALIDCASIFNVNERTIRRWLEGGNDEARIVPEPQGHRGPEKEYVVDLNHLEWLIEHLQKGDNLTLDLDEMSDVLYRQFYMRYTVQQLSAALLRENITYKTLTLVPAEQDPAERARFRQLVR